MKGDGKQVGGVGLFRFQLKLTSVTAWKEIFPSDVVVVFYFVIGVCKETFAILTCFSRFVSSGVVVCHGGQGNLFGKNFVYGLALRRDVVVKTTHYVGTAVKSRRDLVLREICDPMATEPTYLVFVDNASVAIGIGITVWF